MKKGIILLLFAALCLLTGCQNKSPHAANAVPTVEIVRSTYYYDQGYVQAEGWRYDMTISSEKQVAQLNKLCDALIPNMLEEEFLLEQGYRLTWRDASGSATREMLVLSDGIISMQGVLFEANGASELFDWLESLRLDEQSMGE